MRKTLTLISLGLAGWMLAGCEQQQDTLEPADDLGSPANEPEVQIGQGDPLDDPEPASPGTIEREIEPTIIQEDEPGAGGLEPADDPLGDDPLEPEQDPLTPPPQN